MVIYAVFLRAVNVGGNTMVSMKELVSFCLDLGFVNVRSYLNSGNIILESSLPEIKILEILESGLSRKFESDLRIIIRNAIELEQIIKNNPFPNKKGSQVGVMLLNESIENMGCDECKTPGKEEIILGKREVYVYYPDGMGRSKLKWSIRFNYGTMRNINTLTKLVSITNEIANLKTS